MADIYGKIIAVLPTRSGVSARGTQWSSQTAVIETQEQYPKKVAFDVLGDKIAEFNIQVGEMLTVSYDIDAREFNGRWYNSIKAWNVVRQQQQGGAPQQQTVQQMVGGPYTQQPAGSNFPPPQPTGYSDPPF